MNKDLVNSSVLRPQKRVNGVTQTELSTRWWQYVYNIPAPHNPFSYDENNDPHREKSEINQAPPVFNLVGTLGTSNPVVRTVEIKPNQGYQYIFFPLINSEWDRLFPEGASDKQLQGLAKAVGDTALAKNGGNLFLKIDDIAIKDLENYRQTSDKFIYNLPDNNIAGQPSQIIDNAFSDGFYTTIQLSALSPEDHTIKFGGTFNLNNLDIPNNLGLEDVEIILKEAYPDGRFSQDITYNISFELNPVNGTKKQDNLFGTQGWDKINGRAGDDHLYGLEGNDDIYGGRGSDILVGVNPSSANPGRGEIDILNGGLGQDTFVLGDKQNVFYRGNRLEDYAIIRDFTSQDTIQLHGNRRLYELNENYYLGGKEGTAIFLRNNSELIGFVENVDNLNLANSSDFSFVQ